MRVANVADEAITAAAEAVLGSLDVLLERLASYAQNSPPPGTAPGVLDGNNATLTLAASW